MWPAVAGVENTYVVTPDDEIEVLCDELRPLLTFPPPTPQRGPRDWLNKSGSCHTILSLTFRGMSP